MTVDNALPDDLVRHVAGSTGLPTSVAARLITDVVAYFDETPEEFVRRRHGQLQRRGLKNEQIWRLLAREVADRRFRAEQFSERQLRRIVYK